MPLHEYRCDRCGREFEFLHLSRSDRAVCPECESEQLTKRLSVIAAPVTDRNGDCPPPETGPCGPGCCRLP